MDYIKEDTEGIKEGMKHVKRHIDEGTESIKKAVKEVKKDMKERIKEVMEERTKNIEKRIQMKEYCTNNSVENIERGSLENPGVSVFGELYLVGFCFALSFFEESGPILSFFSVRLSDAIPQYLL